MLSLRFSSSMESTCYVKVKIHVILVIDRSVIILTGKDQKPQGKTNVPFAEKDEIAKADIFLALEDEILCKWWIPLLRNCGRV